MTLSDPPGAEARAAAEPSIKGTILVGDARTALAQLDDACAQTCVTSPPYWGLRDYGAKGQIGAEPSVDAYVAGLVEVFRQVRRVLRDDGTLWLNLGDSFTSGGRTWRQSDKKLGARAMSYRPPTPQGLKPKDLVGVPWRVAFALQDDGWYLRTDIVWHKPNALPESVKDRPSRTHEFVFLLTKSERYLYHHDAVRVPARHGDKALQTVWSVNTEPFKGAHFAVFPTALVEPCLRAGSNPGSLVLDPFFGSGTVGEACYHLRRDFIGIELVEEYVRVARERLRTRCRGFAPDVRQAGSGPAASKGR
jgi:site-specific DNA-methyltransferase (cytosine-N4-specific)